VGWQERRAQRAQQSQWLRDRRQYGRTGKGQYVDQRAVQQLVTLGYEQPLAAEALRQVCMVECCCGFCLGVMRVCQCACWCAGWFSN
jgi:hypothetical protein